MEDQQPDQATSSTVTKSSERLRVYQQWQGNEQFFCYGYLVAGPNWKASLGTGLLIAAPSGIFLAFVAPYLTYEVHAIIMVFSCLLPLLCLLFLYMTACRDPGIIGRQDPDEEYLAGRKQRTKEVYVNNHRVVIRYNDTCHFYQPPRAHHCSVNDNCIERFDHHCPWVGTTVGKRNYRTFLLFIYTTTIFCLYVFGCCLAQLFVRHNELMDDASEKGEPTSGLWGKTLGDVAPAIALMAYTFLFFWFVGGLSVFHCYLVGSNQTTYENFRYNHDSRPNPYDRGILKNCAEVWCTAVPPSQVDFRAFVEDRPPKPLPQANNEMMAPAVVYSLEHSEGLVQYPQGQMQYPAYQQGAGPLAGQPPLDYYSLPAQPQLPTSINPTYSEPMTEAAGYVQQGHLPQ